VAEQHELGTGMRGAQALRESDFVFDDFRHRDRHRQPAPLG
jgi:hypothetical protein